MTPHAFREALLEVMERKSHWAWPRFNAGEVPKSKLHLHLEQEYAVFVRDFPVLVGRAYAQCPIPAVRRELAANLYEEETGGLAAGKPHPELFLEYPRGLGFDLTRFEHVTLLPAAQRYRDVIDAATIAQGWSAAAAVVTIFLEGTANERAVLDGAEATLPPLTAHPLVVHYGLPLESLALTRAHRGVEGSHRVSAWRVMLEFVPETEHERVLRFMNEAVVTWHAWRDEVAQVCGLTR